MYGAGYETFSGRFTSAVPLLWTLIIWVGLLAGVVRLGALCCHASMVRRINEFLCRGACVVASGYFLKRWLDRWQLDALNSTAMGWLLLLVVIPVYIFLRHRRIIRSTPTKDVVPSWQDMFAYLVVPVLIATVVAVSLRLIDTVGVNNRVVAASGADALADRPNVILIVADSLRAQSMSLYGHTDQTTPSIDRFAELSSTYSAMHANATTTMTSVLTILTGRHPLSHGRLNRELFPPRPEPLNLLSLLSAHEYSIGAVTSNGDASEVLQSLRSGLHISEEMAFGFNLFSWLTDVGVYPTRFSGRMYGDLAGIFPLLAFPRRASMEGNISETMTRVKNLIARLPPPFFLFVHIQEPHWPYQIPVGFEPAPVRVDGSQLAVSAPYAPVFQPAVDAYRSFYEMTIKALDAELGKFLEATASVNNTLVILTADHGESFERGYFLHGEDLSENSTRVPLLIRYPGQKKGERVAGLTQSFDIAPTVLNVVGIANPDWMDGQSLKFGAVPAPAEVVAINYRYPYDGIVHYLPTKIAIWWDKYKLIAACQSGEALLYDLAGDPQELVDISARDPGVGEDLKRRLRARLSRQSVEPRLSCPNL
ncbi:MAG: sulfatase-like hydrolase/transferase [Candidatus Binatia bacterium]